MRNTRDWVALILALGLALSMVLFTLALLYVAINKEGAIETGLSENATQVLTGWGGGVIGILGAVFGMRVANGNNHRPEPGEETTPES
jgi:hypothetical protein